MTNQDHEFSERAARQALEALGQLCPTGTHVVLVGGAALILGYGVARTTHDIDVLMASPRLAEFGRAIDQVADQLDLAKRWINDGAKAYGEVLPDDFRDRLTHIGRFGHLSVDAVSRRDLLLLKLHALRPEDLEDVDALAPTSDEIAFVRAQLPRIARFDPARAYRTDAYLASQWPDP